MPCHGWIFTTLHQCVTVYMHCPAQANKRQKVDWWLPRHVWRGKGVALLMGVDLGGDEYVLELDSGDEYIKTHSTESSKRWIFPEKKSILWLTWYLEELYCRRATRGSCHTFWFQTYYKRVTLARRPTRDQWNGTQKSTLLHEVKRPSTGCQAHPASKEPLLGENRRA